MVAKVEGGFVAAWDFVQGGGQEAGAPLPYLGFSWSRDGKSWPASQGQLLKVPVEWTDLVSGPLSAPARAGCKSFLAKAMK